MHFKILEEGRFHVKRFYDNFKTRIMLPSDTMKSTNERETETKEDSNNYILADERKSKYMLTGLW